MAIVWCSPSPRKHPQRSQEQQEEEEEEEEEEDDENVQQLQDCARLYKCLEVCLCRIS
jgi:ribosomal protein L12E/L44/L45/RPP1/RPP2